MILSQDENVIIIGLLQILEILTGDRRFCSTCINSRCITGNCDSL